MKINKKLSAAITLSLMLGLCGSASADGYYLYGKDGAPGTYTVNDLNNVDWSITTIKGAVDADTYGTFSPNSNDTPHNFSVDKGDWQYVVGGQKNGDIKDNIVTIVTLKIKKDVYGGISSKGDAVNNTIYLIEDSQASNIYGGWSEQGSTKSNEVNIENDSTITGNVYGGYSKVGDASGNKVISVGSNVGTEGTDGFVYGGYSEKGDVTENTVTVESSKIGSTGSGGYVIILDGSPIIDRSGGVYGGYTGEGIVSGNAVIITGGEISEKWPDKAMGLSIGEVSGGSTYKGDASKNTVSITDATVYISVYGGFSSEGNAISNEVAIKDATVDSKVYGGMSFSGGTVEANTVAITSSASALNSTEITGDVLGGQSFTLKSGAVANNNTVFINGADAAHKVNIGAKIDGKEYFRNVYGGLSTGGTATGNKVGTIEKPVTNFSARNIYGGYSTDGSDKNEVYLGEGAEVHGDVYGGYAVGGAAQNNQVTIFDGTISGTIYGGMASDGAANDNIVNLGGYDDGSTFALNKATVKLTNKIIGGQGKTTKGNTLRVFSKDNEVGALEGFQIEKFYMPGGTKPGDNFVKVGNSVNMEGVEVKVALPEGNPLTYGDKVKLINAPAINGLNDVREANASKTAFTDWVFKVYQGDDAMNQVASGANNVVAELVEDAAGEDSKSLVETLAAATTILADGSDLLASAGFANAAAAINESALKASGSDSEKGSPNAELTIFGAVNGNKSRVKSGSYVDVKGWNFNLGAAKEVENRFGKLLFAPIVEYGIGDYDSYLNDGYHGEGETKYIGGGIMAKQTNNNGVYLEGSVRAGKMTMDYKSNDGRYDSDSPYLAAHFGLGKIMKINDKNNVDIYGKYFYSHQSGDDVTVHGADKDFDLSFDSVNSHRTRLGARFNHIVRNSKSLYAGLAWQHEFSSTARATIDGMTTPSPSMKGDTGILELGVKVTEGEHLGLDLGVNGSIGKKKGAGLSLNFNWKF